MHQVFHTKYHPRQAISLLIGLHLHLMAVIVFYITMFIWQHPKIVPLYIEAQLMHLC